MKILITSVFIFVLFFSCQTNEKKENLFIPGSQLCLIQNDKITAFSNHETPLSLFHNLINKSMVYNDYDSLKVYEFSGRLELMNDEWKYIDVCHNRQSQYIQYRYDNFDFEKERYRFYYKDSLFYSFNDLTWSDSFHYQFHNDQKDKILVTKTYLNKKDGKKVTDTACVYFIEDEKIMTINCKSGRNIHGKNYQLKYKDDLLTEIKTYTKHLYMHQIEVDSIHYKLEYDNEKRIQEIKKIRYPSSLVPKPTEHIYKLDNLENLFTEVILFKDQEKNDKLTLDYVYE